MSFWTSYSYQVNTIVPSLNNDLNLTKYIENDVYEIALSAF